MSTIPLDAALEGDLVACHGHGVVSMGIRVAEALSEWVAWLRFGTPRSDGPRFNHFAWLDGKVPGAPAEGADPAEWLIGQAESAGVTTDQTLASAIAKGGSCEIIRLPAGADRAKFLEFARAQQGRRYGFVTVASILVTLFTPGFIDVMLPNTWICSAVVAESLRFGGWLHSWPDVYCVRPDQLEDALSA